jgi:hypothetical protein
LKYSIEDIQQMRQSIARDNIGPPLSPIEVELRVQTYVLAGIDRAEVERAYAPFCRSDSERLTAGAEADLAAAKARARTRLEQLKAARVAKDE